MILPSDFITLMRKWHIIFEGDVWVRNLVIHAKRTIKKAVTYLSSWSDCAVFFGWGGMVRGTRLDGNCLNSWGKCATCVTWHCLCSIFCPNAMFGFSMHMESIAKPQQPYEYYVSPRGFQSPALETTSCLLYEKSVAYWSYIVAECFNMGAIDRDESLAIGFVTPEMVVLKNVLRKTTLIA